MKNSSTLHVNFAEWALDKKFSQKYLSKKWHNRKINKSSGYLDLV